MRFSELTSASAARWSRVLREVFHGFSEEAGTWSFSPRHLADLALSELTNKANRRGAFVSVDDLTNSIDAFIQSHNDDPKPFVWTASVEKILKKVGKCKAILATEH